MNLALLRKSQSLELSEILKREFGSTKTVAACLSTLKSKGLPLGSLTGQLKIEGTDRSDFLRRLQRMLRWKLVAGVGFEPTAFRL
jgi:hypothetical protein